MDPLLAPIGKLRRFLVDPCAPSFQVLAEAVVPAALKAFWTIVDPNYKEIIRWTTGKSWLCNVKAAAHELTKGEPEGESLGLRFAFTLSEVVDYASWYLFLADVAGEFFINWSTQVMKMTNCHLQPGTRRGYSSTPYHVAATNGEWSEPWDFFYGAPDFPIGVPTNVDLYPGDWCTFSGFVRYEDGFGNQYPSATRIINLTTGQVYDADTQAGSLDPKHHKAFVWHKTMGPATGKQTIAFQTRVDPKLPLENVHAAEGYLSLTWHQGF
jgi:hypothetical protein